MSVSVRVCVFKPIVFVLCACTRVFVYLKIWVLHIQCTPSRLLHTRTRTHIVHLNGNRRARLLKVSRLRCMNERWGGEMRWSDARIEGTPEGEAKISGGAGGGSGKSREDRENKRVCGCCYLKGLDKVSMTDSVRSEHNPMPRVRHGCQIVGGRADGFRGYTICFGQGEHTHTYAHAPRRECAQACRAHPCGKTIVSKGSHQHK